MKLFVVIMVVLVCGGCVTKNVVKLQPEQLQRKIAAGEVFAPGEYVTVGTADGEKQSLKVVAVSDVELIGDKVKIPIDTIVSVETREATLLGTTAGVAVGLTCGYLLMAIPAAVIAKLALAGL